MTSKTTTHSLRNNELHAMQAITAVLTAVPLIGGLAGVIGGPALVAGDHGYVDASTDSEFRFLSAAWLSMAPLIWTALPTAHDRPATLRIIGAGIVVGGMARLRSWRRLGRPQAMMVAGAALELVGVPALLVWHTRIVHRLHGSGSLVE
ncbi:MAG TPA: DUF4345 domain-containing protein [Mycobacterium sp.]|nr:DUF4345 domain-containing protein [Mycobacterium sp.]